MSRPQPTVLSKKDAELFIQLVDCFDKKDNKRGIQIADSILKRSPNHGQTLSMKGAVLNQMGKKEEALELVKKGLQLDIRSHICWHVYGIVHKSQKNYKEAARCYHQASRLDPNNQTLLRDLSWIQAQNRDFAGFSESRNKLLTENPKARSSWLAFSISKFFLKDYNLAFNLLDKYYDIFPRPTKKTKSPQDQPTPYEDSEVVLYRANCLIKAEKYQEAIDFIMKNLGFIQDEMAVRNYLAICYTFLNNHTDAINRYVDLLTYFPENYEHHKGLQINFLKLATDEKKKKMYALKGLNLPCNFFDLSFTELNSIYEKYIKLMDFNKKFETSRTFKKIKLTLLCAMALKNESKKTAFVETLTTFIESSCNSSIPSLYQDLFTLIRVEKVINNEKLHFLPNSTDDISNHTLLNTFEEITEKYISKISSSSDSNLTPLSYLWAEFLKSYIAEWRGDLPSALVSIEKCLKHTPTALDMYIRKANILKKSGAINESAALLADNCYPLDLQDRYLNNKATKYLLRAGEMNRALQTIAFFTKYDVSRGESEEENEEVEEVTEDEKKEKTKKKSKAPATVSVTDFVLLKKVEDSLSSIQCTWFELEMAEGYSKDKNWGQALRKLQSIRKNFSIQYTDLADFHAYCMRNYALRTYLDIYESLDLSYAHPNFQRAATEALRIYFHLNQYPEDFDGLGHLSTNDRKKDRVRLKKMKEKRELQFVETSSGSKPFDASDLYGDSLVTNRDFIADAAEWVELLWPVLYGLNPELLGLMAEVKVRLGKFDDALICLKLALGQEVTEPIKSFAPINPFSTIENREYEVLESIAKILYRLSLPISKKLAATVTTDHVDDFKAKILTISNNFFEKSVSDFSSSIQLPADFLASNEEVKNFLSNFLNFTIKSNFVFNYSSFFKAFLVFDNSENFSLFKTFFNDISSSFFSLPAYRGDYFWNISKSLNQLNLGAEFMESFNSKCQQKFPLIQISSSKIDYE